MKKRTALFGVGIFALTIILFYVAYNYVFFVNLFDKNFVGLLTWSIFSGLVVAFYHYLNRKLALTIFLSGYVIAFTMLFSTFANTDNTFASITGLLMFIYILAGGFVISLISEGILYLIKRKRKA